MKVTKVVFLSMLCAANAYANEPENNIENEFTAYCTEQADLAGIQDENEKRVYIEECVESLILPSDGSASATE